MSQFKFFQRKQNTLEPFDKFYTDLKKLVKNCDFIISRKQKIKYCVHKLYWGYTIKKHNKSCWKRTCA